MDTNFIRLSLGRELTEEELDQVIEIVDANAEIKETYGYSDGEYCEFEVIVLTDDVSFYYEISLEYEIEEEDGNAIATGISSIIEDDFELDAG